MSEVIRSIENCEIKPINPQEVHYEDFYTKATSHGKEYGCISFLIWALITTAGYIFLSTLDFKLHWLAWIAPIGIATIITAVIIDELDTKELRKENIYRREQARKKSKEVNRKNEKNSIEEAKRMTLTIKESIKEALLELNKLNENFTMSYDHMQNAVSEFNSNAFSPYWDNIQSAIIYLSDCEENLNLLKRKSEFYNSTLSNREHDFPKFPVKKENIPNLSVATEDLKEIIRLGQTNFEFSNIYEQRRTREVLIAGFKNLGDAVNNFNISINESHENLVSSLENIASDVKEIASKKED